MNKSILLALTTLLLIFYSCSDEKDVYPTKSVTLQLVYPSDSDFEPKEGVSVKLTSGSTVFEGKTDALGKVVIVVPEGLYDASASETRTSMGMSKALNGLTTGLSVSSSWNETTVVNIEMKASTLGGIIIKEYYFGGVTDDAGAGTYAKDGYVVLYNNSSVAIDLNDFGLAVCNPSNGHASNKYYGTDGKLIYENEGWIPAGGGIWTFQNQPKLEPGKQLVIAIFNAIDNTLTYENSINFVNPEYYACYDEESGFINKLYYSKPTVIPTQQWLKAHRVANALGNAWVMSQISPAIFIFSTEDKGVGTIEQFINDANSTINIDSPAKKVNVDWVIDGVEVFKGDVDTNKKRLTANIDGGAIKFVSKKGYTIYRNVDKKATEAIAENEGKLVYSYAGGTEAEAIGSTDPSGIDAEASIKNGARVVYKDTNNSTEDFHQRRKASLRK